MSERAGGFTLIELVVTVAIVAILAAVAVPMVELSRQRNREQDLKLAVHDIRTAIDQYKRVADEGRIYRRADASGYPPTLETLVEGVPDLRKPGRKFYFLRRLPRDPMNDDQTLTPGATWGKRSYASEANAPKEGEDVYDVYSLSPRTGMNNVPYREW